MLTYGGPRESDERPIGGGGFNKNDIGHEAYNFHAVAGSLYGYFQPNMRSEVVNLERIDPKVAGKNSTGQVLVVFVAPAPGGGCKVVGWYKDAEVWRERVRPAPGKPRGYGYLCRAAVGNCVLLPPGKRKYPIPSQVKGAFGRSNVCYVLETDGSPKAGRWIKDAVDYIDHYDGPNLLTAPESIIEDEVEAAAEESLARISGQGFARTAAQRKAIEDHSMAVAKRYFRRKDYQVEDVSTNRSYDLACRKGSRVLHVEVKGTTTAGEQIVLTANEVRHAKNPRNHCVLFVLHGITLHGRKASGGTIALQHPWKPADGRLKPITFVYRLDN
ncbi:MULTISPECIES: protein NO VEIN domain-containing protein [unclassified Bradyrhizobium]|uniref:protein NO VEIN domain-containing protein n=1 Tax=Bradyrhizobium sp. USDA 4541 TaxID=2817704 RepID=UPI0020A42954|nr:DUF3883 domain-containing protein [Bradyrhizobium sp. USDA 4541]MCP1850279.1 hypothetical protein [Bradyrhizobium sp. USDA 4541]